MPNAPKRVFSWALQENLLYSPNNKLSLLQ